MNKPNEPSIGRTERGRKGVTLALADDPHWYMDAVIYQVHVKSYFDSNNDGIGDFPGLIEKLDYIASLGVDTIWLLPFYPSPRLDDGYDIAEYKGVHPDYGTIADARRFIQEAHARGLRVITELVINHTSDQHPWFQRARAAKPGSAARNFYVWSDTDQRYQDTRIIFIDTEKSNWAWDPVAQAYYWHRFYSHQPDLNFDNPAVLRAVFQVMKFWLSMGVDGLRLDAVPYLVEREGTNNENLPETHAILKRLRAELDATFPNRMLLAEANQWPEDTRPYFGEGDECHMAFNFPLMPRMYMALAQEDRFPITDILRQTPDVPPGCQWAIFLRNHDELTLEMVTDRERDYLWETYASERRARLNLGIRRRLAPLLEQDRRRIELLNSLLLSMPGTPVIYYGDEIGMGDNIHLGDRDGVRTPMQWSPDRNGGFSRIDPAKLVLPVIMDANYGYQAINVEAESLNPHSLLNWMRRMLAIRKRHCAFGRGSMTMLNPTNRRVLAYLREHGGRDGQGETILCVANLSRAAQAVELDLSSYGSMVPVEMIGNSAFPPIGQLPYLLTLPPYGFFWFMLSAPARMPDWHQPPPEPMPDYMTLVIRKDVTEIFSGAALEALEHKILPAYLPRRRWFASKDQKLDSVKIVEATIMQTPTRPIALMEIETRSGGAVDRYLLPLGRINENEVISALPGQIALARIRRGREIGFLTDAFTLDRLAYGILDGLRKQQVLPARDGAVHFIPTERMAELDIPPDAAIRRLAVEQSNSSLIVGEQAMIKILRRIHPGEHPEAEMGRLLTARGYANIAPLLGEVVRIAADGTPHLLAVVQGYIHSQGDAWAWTLQQLERALHPGVDTPGGEPEEVQSLVTQWFGRLGTRVGELHAVLAQDSSDPAFAPERVTEQQCAAWASAVQSQIDDALSRIKQHRESLDPADAALGDALAASSAPLHAAAATLARAGLGSLMTRTHGDLHLGQVLVAQGDAYIIDFEGEPARPLAERRGKSSPLRDVAGMLRSIDYVRAKAAEQALGVEGARDAQEIEAQLDRFRAAAQHAFLEAYFAASATIAHGWAGDSAPQALIDLFTLEKAAYEIAYEAANRPPWLRVPLRGLAETAQRLGALESANG